MSERIYRWLLALYPKTFRKEYGPAALELFRDRIHDERGFFAHLRLWLDLVSDAVVSIPREYSREEPVATAVPVPNGVPVFFSFKSEWPHRGALLNGAFISICLFAVATLVTMNSDYHGVRWIGSHHASTPRILVRASDLDTEVKLRAFPFEPVISDYFRFIQVLGSLDVDRDGVISDSEIADAPAALRALDKNRGGELSPAECGFHPWPDDAKVIARAAAVFMTIHPVLRALDSDHDGEISAREIAWAPWELRTLDRNGDGRLTEDELLPDRASVRVAQLMLTLDTNGDGKLSPEEYSSSGDLRLSALFGRTLINHEDFVTAEDLLRVWSAPDFLIPFDRVLTPTAAAISR